MKKIIFIITILALSFGCKKGDKCVVGGKWYHVKSVWNGAVVQENNGSYVIFSDSKVEYYNSNGILTNSYNIVITDETIGGLEYECKDNELKIKYGVFNQGDVIYNDFNANYNQYKR